MVEMSLIDYIEKMSEKLMNFNGNLNLNFIGKLIETMPKLELLMPVLIIIMNILETDLDLWLLH